MIFVWQATVRLVRNRSALPTVLRQRVQVTFWIHEFNFVRFTLSRGRCQPDLLKALLRRRPVFHLNAEVLDARFSDGLFFGEAYTNVTVGQQNRSVSVPFYFFQFKGGFIEIGALVRGRGLDDHVPNTGQSSIVPPKISFRRDIDLVPPWIHHAHFRGTAVLRSMPTLQIAAELTQDLVHVVDKEAIMIDPLSLVSLTAIDSVRIGNLCRRRTLLDKGDVD